MSAAKPTTAELLAQLFNAAPQSIGPISFAIVRRRRPFVMSASDISPVSR